MTFLALLYKLAVVSILMAACISVDIRHHGNRRRQAWVWLGLLLGPLGVAFYLGVDKGQEWRRRL